MAASRLCRALSASLAVLLVALTARSSELAGVRLADTVTVQQTQLVLNGLSLRTATLVKVPV